MQSHGVTGTFHLSGDLVVITTWLNVSAWVVVGECYDGGVAEYGFLDDKSHINGGLGYSAMRQAHGLNVLVVIVH